MTGITILGATGSIGKSTLEVLALHPEQYQIVALTAHKNVERMTNLCQTYKPTYAVMVDNQAAIELKQNLAGQGITILSGMKALEEVAALDEVDYVMAAIVGAAGLLSSLAAAKAGKRVLLANKESLVMSGDLFMQAIHENNAELLPIDSEHNAIFQSMPANFYDGLKQTGVERILLTASGGPFRTTPLEELETVTPEQAVAHPNWEMGKKISVDSATMMNKGLEVIEAHWLFNAGADDIQVVIHPQSVIHSMVSYTDGSVLAQLGNPDMRTPIAHALAWPQRMKSGVEPLDIFKVAQLDFETPDFERFPCLNFAYEALRAGGTAPTILNAANEIAVEAFLDKRLPYNGISQLIDDALQSINMQPVDSLDIVIEADIITRKHVNKHLLAV
jgi:1-deoxy-D-xylulose-5-phosphate reductoisomerase